MTSTKSKKSILYEEFHKDKRLQKKIISDNNFTYRELIKILKPLLPKVKNVLDIGSGVGTIDFYLADKGKNVTGIEISKQAVELAKKNSQLFKLEKKITFINAAFPSKISQSKFDLVIFSEVIEHLENDEKVLKDIWKVLKPGGLLVITTPSLNAPLYRLGLLKNFDKKVGHLRRYTTHGLIKVISESGFDVITFGKHEGILRNFLFTNDAAGKLIKFIRGFFSEFIALIDSLTIPLMGESNIHFVAKKPVKKVKN